MVFKTLHDKRVLVTGGAGFMGSSFIRYLLSKEDFEGVVINFDALTYCGNLDHLDSVKSDPRYFFYKGNILDQKALEHVFKKFDLDMVIHFAAETHVDRSILDASNFIQTNIVGTANLVEMIRKFPKVHLHHVSTDEVYGALGDQGVFYEDSPYLPNSPYSASKAASDHLVRAYHKTYGLSVTISHAGNNYGPCQYPEKLIPFMIQRLINKQTLPLYGNGMQIRDWVFVDDHARAIEAILLHGSMGEVYNIASEEERTNLDLLHQLIETYGKHTGSSVKEFKDQIRFVQDRPGHDFRYAMSAEKIKTETGWRKQVSLNEGLEKTVAWHLREHLIRA